MLVLLLLWRWFLIYKVFKKKTHHNIYRFDRIQFFYLPLHLLLQLHSTLLIPRSFFYYSSPESFLAKNHKFSCLLYHFVLSPYWSDLKWRLVTNLKVTFLFLMENREFHPESTIHDFDLFRTINEFFSIFFSRKFQTETARVVLLNFCNIGVRKCFLDI